MKAIVIDDYGGVDQLHLRELPDSRPHADEVLVRVRAAGVNPVDWKICQGQLRFILRLNFPFIPGGDIAGEVVSTGPETTEFKAGDPVVGFVDLKRGGGYAELAVAKKSAVALISPSLSFTEAASLPIAGCTALQALRDLGKLSEGGKALILGGAGGVGHFAVQIAKALGAKTSATCGPSNIAFVQSLGTDHVIDYSGKDFMADVDHFDVIFDAVGKSSFISCGPLLAPGGTYVTTLPTPSLFFWSGVQSIAGIFGNPKRAKGILVQPSGKDLAYLCQLADEGKLRPTVSLTCSLDHAAEAHEASEACHTRGKIVLGV
jgi:2-desacetyl-2-hydroxyethyl bacteriochlorophyllide A dehydrogenase